MISNVFKTIVAAMMMTIGTVMEGRMELLPLVSCIMCPIIQLQYLNTRMNLLFSEMENTYNVNGIFIYGKNFDFALNPDLTDCAILKKTQEICY